MNAARFGSRLGLVTWHTEALQVEVIISAAKGLANDVINLKLLSDLSAFLAGVLIPDQDALTNSTPWPPAASGAPFSGGCRFQATCLRRLNSWLQRLKPTQSCPLLTGEPSR